MLVQFRKDSMSLQINQPFRYLTSPHQCSDKLGRWFISGVHLQRNIQWNASNPSKAEPRRSIEFLYRSLMYSHWSREYHWRYQQSRIWCGPDLWSIKTLHLGGFLRIYHCVANTTSNRSIQHFYWFYVAIKTVFLLFVQVISSSRMTEYV